MDHLQHFGLRLDPFQIEPDLRFYYDSALHSNAQRRVERGLRQSKGLSILTGEGGTGKSLLARRLFGGLEEELFEAALMVMLPGAADARSVLGRFARHLEIEDLSDDPAKAMGQVYEQLAVVREDGRHSVLILDDAHLLSSAALAEVGSLLSLEYEERRLVSILLIGLPDLDVDVSQDRSLGQRVDIRVHLASLDLESSGAYLANRLQVAGGAPEIIPPEAIHALFKHGQGRPRLMNTLADNALYEAYLEGRDQLEASDVERAAGDLGVGLQPVDPSAQSAALTPIAAPGPLATPAQPSPGFAAAAPAQETAVDPIETPPLAPALDLSDSDDDLGSLLDTIESPVGDELVAGLDDPLAAAELDLDVEVGPETPDHPPERHLAEETCLMLGDDDSGVLAMEDSRAFEADSAVVLEDTDAGLGLELGDPIDPTSEFELAMDGGELAVEGDAEASDLELADAAGATRLMLPGEDEAVLASDAGGAAKIADTADAADTDDSDEIEALFDQLLDD